MLSEPCPTGKANRPAISDNPNASHNGFSRSALRSIRPGIDCAMIFVAANQYAILIFALSAKGCLPSNVHWNNPTTGSIAYQVWPRASCKTAKNVTEQAEQRAKENRPAPERISA